MSLHPRVLFVRIQLRPYTAASTHRCVHTPLRPHTAASMHRRVHAPLRPHIAASIHRCVHTPLRPYTAVSTHRCVHTPLRPYTAVSTHRCVHTSLRPYTAASTHRWVSLKLTRLWVHANAASDCGDALQKLHLTPGTRAALASAQGACSFSFHLRRVQLQLPRGTRATLAGDSIQSPFHPLREGEIVAEWKFEPS
eukprot:349918-Chlamydomonas_euryale.AAC.5